jgi:hypothetical protein
MQKMCKQDVAHKKLLVQISLKKRKINWVFKNVIE